MRQHCAIPNGLDRTRCLACRDPRTATAAGEREHLKTGVCEACWDLLVADTEAARSFDQQMYLKKPTIHVYP